MSLFVNLSITKFLRRVKWLLILLLLLAVVSMGLLFNAFNQERKVINQNIKQRELARELLERHYYIAEQVRKYVNEAKEEYYENYKKTVEEERYQEIKRKFKALEVPEEELSLIEKSIKKGIEARSTEQQAFELIREGLENPRHREQNLSQARDLIYGDYYDSQRIKAMNLVEEFIEKMEAQTAKETKNLQAKVDLFLLGSIISLSLLFILTLLVFFVLNGKVTKPINKIAGFADELAAGDLTVSDLRIRNGDEIGQLSRNLNQIKSNLKRALNKLSNVDDEVEKAVEIARETKQEEKEVSRKIGQVSNKTAEMLDCINDLIYNSKQVLEKERTSISLIEKSTNKITSGNKLVEKMAIIMKKLIESTDKVEEITDKIKDISSLEEQEISAKIKEVVQEMRKTTKEAIDIMIPADGSNKNIVNLFKEIDMLSNQVLEKAVKAREIAEEQEDQLQQLNISADEISDNSKGINMQTDKLVERSKELEDIIQEIAKINKKLTSDFDYS